MVALGLNLFMDKLVKRGLWCMAAAVLLMPLAVLLKNTHDNATVVILFFSMTLELIGLIFVIVHMIRRRKA